MDQITNSITLLRKNNINTFDELNAKLDELNSRKEALIKERKTYYGKINRCKSKKDEERKVRLQLDAKSITEEIQNITKEVKLYEGVKVRFLSIQESMNTAIQEERKESELDECRWRDSRPSRKDESSRH